MIPDCSLALLEAAKALALKPGPARLSDPSVGRSFADSESWIRPSVVDGSLVRSDELGSTPATPIGSAFI